MAIKLELEIKEVELLLAGLYKLPMEFAEPVVAKVKAQGIPQAQAQQAAEAEANPTPVEVTPAEPLPEEPSV
jgi:hypothetical protein